MNCPLCQAELIAYHNPGWTGSIQSHTAYECEDPNCLNKDMPRYKMVYEDDKIISRTIQFGNIHVAIDYRNQITVVSTLVACFLTNTIQLPRAVEWDDSDPDKTLQKVKLLLTFA